MDQLEITRTFDASLESLWDAWTKPENFMKWYGPKGFTAPTCEIDLQVGGRHLWSMQSPDGMQMYFTGTYKEVSPMERLIFTDGMSDAEGTPVGMGGQDPFSMDVTVTFSNEDGKTTVTVSHMSSGPEDRAGMGWNQAFDKLEEALVKN